jgi:hypothetical protein
MQAFNEASLKIELNDLSTISDNDEQMGFKFVFAGSMSAIRNPRGHDIRADPIDLCLDHLSFASVLLRTFVAASRRYPQASQPEPPLPLTHDPVSLRASLTRLRLKPVEAC